MYRLIEQIPARSWREFAMQIYRCSHCRALLVVTLNGAIPKVCGKCHR